MRKRVNGKLKLIVAISSSIILLIVAIFIINSGNLQKLMGNSVVLSEYYCEDNTFTLMGDKCQKQASTQYMMLGDVNLDGHVNSQDRLYLYNYLNKKDGYEITDVRIADIDEDGDITQRDLDALSKYVSRIFLRVGDVNDDHIVDINDRKYLVYYLTHARGYESINEKQADINEDGKIDANDLELLSNYVSYPMTVALNPTEADTNSHNVAIKRYCPVDYKLTKDRNSCIKTITVVAKKYEYIKGDINKDNNVDEQDYSLLNSYLNQQLELNQYQKKIADLNQDGVIDNLDLDILKKMINSQEKTIDVKISNIDKVDINNIKINDVIKYQANIANLNKKLYYKWYDITKTNNENASNCLLVTNTISNLNIIAKEDGQYGILRLYNDSNCLNKYAEYKTDEITLEKEIIPNTASLDFKIVSPLNVNSDLVNKDTKFTFEATYKITGNKQYYAKWRAIKDDKEYASSACEAIKNNGTKITTLTINGKDQHGIWTIYDDANCSDTNVVEKYNTSTYNYIADSVNLNITNTKLMVGSKLKLNAKVQNKINNQVPVKWTNSNVSVAIVDQNGNVNAKNEGSTTITATVGGKSATAKITVVKPGLDNDIKCPVMDYDQNNIKLTVNDTIDKYDIYYSTNNVTGTNAKWQYKNTLKGNQIIGKNNSAQVKLVVYGKYGTTKNCYSTLLQGYYTISSTATCPKITYDNQTDSGAKKYTFKKKNNTVTSGVKLSVLNISANKNFQYSWYTLQSDGSYKLFKTYSNSNGTFKPSITGQKYDRNGLIVVTDQLGNSIYCYSNYVNNLHLNKTKHGSTDLYAESNYSSSSLSIIKSKLNDLNKTHPEYMPVSKIFLYTENTYVQLWNAKSCGLINSARYIAIREPVTACSNNSGTLTHELGHGIDYMYGYLTDEINGNKIDLHNSTIKYNGSNPRIGSFINNYRGSKYLRDYSYTNEDEFWADLFSYQEHGFKVDNTLINVRANALSNYTSFYNKNKTKFNDIKERYR